MSYVEDDSDLEMMETNLAHHKPDEYDDHVELYFVGDSWKLAYQGDNPIVPQGDEILVVMIYKTSGGQKKVVVERADAILTKEEEHQFWPLLAAAMVEELQTWVKHGCVSRKNRRQARNIIDCRWVFKWKFDRATQDANSTASAAVRRVVRARLCIRGFKDVDKDLVAKYAGTSQRYTQRILCSEAVIRGWDIANTDISKAFLQGVTYKELAEMTGEPLREVNFDLPPILCSFYAQDPRMGNARPSKRNDSW